MKKYVQNIWVRLLACLLCAVSVVGLALSIIGSIFFAYYPDKDKVLEEGNETLLLNYALYATDYMYMLEEEGIFDDINAYITIEKWEYASEEAEEPTETDRYSNMPEGVTPTFVLEDIRQNNKVYSLTSLVRALDAYYSEWSYDYSASTPIQGYVFDVNTGLFYYQTAVGYFKADYINVFSDGVYYDYRLTEKNGEEYYYNGYYDRRLDPSEYENWDWVSLNDKRMGISESYSGNWVLVVTDSALIEEYECNKNYYVDSYTLYYMTEHMTTYNVEMAMTDTLTHQDLFYQYYNLVEGVYQYQDDMVGLQISCILLLVFSIILLAVSAPEDPAKLRFFHKIPVCIYTGCVIAVEVLLCAAICLFMDTLSYSEDWIIGIEGIVVFILEVLFAMVFLAFVYIATMITRIKTRTLFRYSEFYYISRPISFVWNLAKNNVPMFTKCLLGMLAITLIQGIVIVYTHWYLEDIFSCFVIYKLVEIPLVIYILVQMKRLQEGGERIASGDLAPIDTKGMFWEFKKHGENINKVGDGIALAVEEQMKSERFKTELITNVSHDIKTPLTSIINYVDLIKKEEITDPTLTEYVEVLERQSARLKKLIEDLMEASKASTGNLEVHLEECDMNVCLSQAVGEFEEKLAENGLEVIVLKPEESVIVMADGRHIWRVLDNLLNNVCKYSQPNTRVYISLEQNEKEAIITFKNISKMALNIPSDQLMQRFVRGDSSRHTEGSGLGLSIAQSLTELMNGTLRLDIDGDLFKVTLKLNKIITK